MAKSSDSRNHTKTILLFKDQDHDRHEIAAEIKEPSLQMRVWSDSLFPFGTSELGITDTPISQKASLIPPNAPIKPRKHVCKKDLKPKKLYFTDKELENERDDANCSQKSALLLTKKSKQKSKSHKRETDSSEKLNRDSLSAMLESIRLELDNKENRRQGHEKRTRINNSVAKERAKKNNCSQSSELSCNLRDLNITYSPLSLCNNTLSNEEKLLWLQPRRDVGMWIQCCRKSCKKWRYCDDFHDPVDVPKIWYCKMNSNKALASCFIPEVVISQEIDDDCIENKYNAGSLVWGRVDGYPWWPAMVDDCPETLRYYELKERSNIPVKYHVIFFKDELQHVWLNNKNIKAFAKTKQNTLVKKKYDDNNMKLLKEICALVQNAISLTILERLQRYSYISRLKNLENSVNCDQSNEKQIDEISSTPNTSSNYITLKEFHSKNKGKKPYCLRN